MTYVKKTHRFGLLTPSSNTTQEPEFSAALPPAVSLHTGRVSYRDITPEEQDRCVLELEAESRKLADAEVDVVVFAATAPTLAKGKGYDRELIKRMEDASGRPATTAATAFVDALRLLGAEKVSIGAPWSKTMDKPMVEFMEASGFKVVHSETTALPATAGCCATISRRDVTRFKSAAPVFVPAASGQAPRSWRMPPVLAGSKYAGRESDARTDCS
jgi:maleate isomerase